MKKDTTELLPATREAQPLVSQSDSIMSVIAKAASDPNVNVDKMERLYAMLKEENARIAEQQFNASMRLAQSEMPRLVKDGKNPMTNSKFVQLETLHKQSSPIIAKHGFSPQFSQGDGAAEGKIRVLCKLSHEGGHSCVYHLDLSPDDTGQKGLPSKTKIHGEGSTFTYGQRYLLKLIFNMTILNEDDDGNRGNQPRQSGPATATADTRKRFVAALSDIKEKALGYAIDLALIEPNQTLDDWPVEHIPMTKADFAELRKDIEAHQ